MTGLGSYSWPVAGRVRTIGESQRLSDSEGSVQVRLWTQEEDRAGDDTQVAWEEEGDSGEGNLALGCKDPGVAGQAISPHPIPASPLLRGLNEEL